MLNKALRAAVLAVPLASGSLTAQAEPVTIGGAALAFSWEFDTDPGPGVGLIIEGTGTMTATLVNTDDLQLVITLNNDTVPDPGENMALVSFGFGTNPNATGVSVVNNATGPIWDAELNGPGGGDTIPSLGDVIEVCAFTGNSCSGGPQPDGLQAGASDTFTLILAGDFNDSSTVDIGPIGFKFQGTIGSFEFFTTDREPPEETPEPGSLLLLGLGMAGLAVMQRRRRRV